MSADTSNDAVTTGCAMQHATNSAYHLLPLPVPVCRRNEWYKQHRHKIVAGQHILRVLAVLVSACKISQGLQVKLAQAMYASSRQGPPVMSVPRIALSNATKPLFVAAIITQGYVSVTRLWALQAAQQGSQQ